MKNIAFLLFSLLFVTSCKKNKDEIIFPFPLQDIDFAIPPTASTFQVHYFNLDNVVTNHEGLFSSNNIDEMSDYRIVPAEASFNVLVGNIDYDFIEQMSIRICNAGDVSENCGIEIFWRQPVPLNVGSILDLIPSDIDIKQYLTQEKVNIQVKLEMLRQNPPQFVETRLLLDFAVR
ncbi:MAG: hypothetical protein ACI85O_000814 [Saprospiraceae bacterium]|jgi:hypothetical protein